MTNHNEAAGWSGDTSGDNRFGIGSDEGADGGDSGTLDGRGQQRGRVGRLGRTGQELSGGPQREEYSASVGRDEPRDGEERGELTGQVGTDAAAGRVGHGGTGPWAAHGPFGQDFGTWRNIHCRRGIRRLQARIVELARLVDPDAPFASALLLWSAWHGVVSLRLHKNEWDWGMTAQEANRRLVQALATNSAKPAHTDRPAAP